MEKHPICSFTLLIVAVFATAMVTPIRGQQTSNRVDTHEYCAPVVSYVEVDPEYKLEPLVVKLHRCVGKNRGTSRNKVCVAKTTSNVTFHVDDFTGVLKTNVISNHTSCVERCRYNASICNANQTWENMDCTCQCKFRTPQMCDEGFRWDRYRCACVCPTHGRPMQCGDFKTFSEETCGCVCEAKRARRCRKKGMYIDPDTCFCTSNPPYTGAQEAQDCAHHTGVISKVGLILLCISEAILFVIGYVMYRKYCKDQEMFCNFKRKTESVYGGDGGDNLPRHMLIHNTPNAEKRSLHTPTIELPPPSVVTNSARDRGVYGRQPNKSHSSGSISNNNRLYGGGSKAAVIGSSSSCDALLREEQSTDYLHENDHERSLEEERDAWRRSYRDMVKV